MSYLIEADRTSGLPLFIQVYEQLRDLILQGELKAGEKMPSTRELAQDIHVSRNVILEAYDQLIAEGYLESRHGSGTYVALNAQLSDFTVKQDLLTVTSTKVQSQKNRIIDFRTGIPLLDKIPVPAFKRILQDILLTSPVDIWSYGEPEGCEELRSQLAVHLRRTRGVYCNADQIIITSGTIQSLSIIAKLLLKPKDEVLMEDPVNEHIQKIFTIAGAALLPVPVDHCGLCTSQLPYTAHPKLIFTTPSHQFPMGSVLSIQRRLELIQYAKLKDCYIIEDDFDSEFRYSGAPISSLQGLAQERVIYAGTFSKVLSPSLRIGYMILPNSLVEPCRELKRLSDHHTPLLGQLMVHELIRSGFLQRHIASMKKIYKKKQELFVTLLKEYFPQIEIMGEATGLHIVARFPNIVFTEELRKIIANQGVLIYPVENHSIKKGFHKNELIFGYVNLTQKDLETGLGTIKKALEQYQSS